MHARVCLFVLKLLFAASATDESKADQRYCVDYCFLKRVGSEFCDIGPHVQVLQSAVNHQRCFSIFIQSSSLAEFTSATLLQDNSICQTARKNNLTHSAVHQRQTNCYAITFLGTCFSSVAEFYFLWTFVRIGFILFNKYVVVVVFPGSCHSSKKLNSRKKERRIEKLLCKSCRKFDCVAAEKKLFSQNAMPHCKTRGG